MANYSYSDNCVCVFVCVTWLLSNQNTQFLRHISMNVNGLLYYEIAKAVFLVLALTYKCCC